MSSDHDHRKSQSHRTDQGDSEHSSHRKGGASRNEGRNPTVLTRAIPSVVCGQLPDDSAHVAIPPY
jgi:hypothetical protein